jgi:cytidylate kinase
MNTLDQSLQKVYGLQQGGSVVQDMMMRPGMQMPPQDMMQRGPVSEQEIDMMVDDVSKDMNDEEKQILESMLERGLAIQESPLAAEVAQLKQYGEVAIQS